MECLLSLVGRGFFSAVSVCFSLLLSKVLTSLMSGLSPIAASFSICVELANDLDSRCQRNFT